MMNDEIKRQIQETGLFQWQIAKALGVTAGTLTVWLRDDPLSEDKQQRIIQAIKKLASNNRKEDDENVSNHEDRC